MTVVAVTMVKDEADIVAATVGHMLSQVDHVIVADNLSSDGTRRILEDLGVHLVVDDDPAYRQSEKMTALARLAHDFYDADWIVPFDADELWYSPFGRIADVLQQLAPQWLVAAADLYDHVSTGVDDVAERDPVRRIQWRRPQPGPLPKVACRWRDDLVIEQGNHGARYIGGPTVISGRLVIRHFPYRSAEQMARKARNGAAAYAATDLDESIGAHWRGYGRILDTFGQQGIDDVFHDWFWAADPIAAQLVHDPALLAAEATCTSA